MTTQRNNMNIIIEFHIGKQGMYYVVDDFKYDARFPIDWAFDHHTFQINGEDYEDSGPNGCGNCRVHGCINNVFVGYCSNCLRCYEASGEWRGNLEYPGIGNSFLSEFELWTIYPYLTGVYKSNIGDIDDPENDDEMEQLIKVDLANINNDYEEDEDLDDIQTDDDVRTYLKNKKMFNKLK